MGHIAGIFSSMTPLAAGVGLQLGPWIAEATRSGPPGAALTELLTLGSGCTERRSARLLLERSILAAG